MGVCCSEEQSNKALQNYLRRRRERRRTQHPSIIYEERTVRDPSFHLKVQNQYRQDLHFAVNQIATSQCQPEIVFGSQYALEQEQTVALIKSLEAINPNGEQLNLNEPITLCNLKTKNFLHTHKIRHPQLPKEQEVSACPHTSFHIQDYDLWKLIAVESNRYLLYHPFTQKFLAVIKGTVVCSDVKFPWKIINLGKLRNGGFIKMVAQEQGKALGELCMTDSQSLLSHHRKLQICSEMHIGHLWQLNFGESTSE